MAEHSFTAKPKSGFPDRLDGSLITGVKGVATNHNLMLNSPRRTEIESFTPGGWAAVLLAVLTGLPHLAMWLSRSTPPFSETVQLLVVMELRNVLSQKSTS